MNDKSSLLFVGEFRPLEFQLRVLGPGSFAVLQIFLDNGSPLSGYLPAKSSSQPGVPLAGGIEAGTRVKDIVTADQNSVDVYSLGISV